MADLFQKTSLRKVHPWYSALHSANTVIISFPADFLERTRLLSYKKQNASS